jgi:signal transduction histidine kinase
LADKAKAKELSVRFDLPETAAVRTDEAFLAAVLSNLLSNAVEYAPEGSTVRCSVSGSGDRLQADVENDAPELVEEDLEHLFEPFWRKDAARSDGGHSGVGLAIAAAYAKLLGAELAASLVGEGRLRMRVKLMP